MCRVCAFVAGVLRLRCKISHSLLRRNNWKVAMLARSEKLGQKLEKELGLMPVGGTQGA